MRYKYVRPPRHPFTTPSTVPASVRPSVWEDWTRFWRRLRRGYSDAEREAEFKVGTQLVVEGTRFRIRWDGWRFHVSIPRPGRVEELPLEGATAFGHGKPYVHADQLQDVLDALAVRWVMES